MFTSPYKDVCAVDKLLQPLLGNEQNLVKQEEGSLLLHPLNLEGTFQNQLSEAAEVWAAPVHQQGLDLLRRGDKQLDVNQTAGEVRSSAGQDVELQTVRRSSSNMCFMCWTTFKVNFSFPNDCCEPLETLTQVEADCAKWC